MLIRVVPLCDFVVVYDNSKAYNKVAIYKDDNWILYDEGCSWFKILNNRVINAHVGLYSTIIELKKDIPTDILSQLKEKIEAAFSNRAGTVKSTGTDPYYFVFAGGEDEYGCLDLGTLELKNEKLFLNNVLKWDWIEDNPRECCDLIEVFLKRGTKN